MNKIQKILWSIFSGMVCIVYRSDAMTVSHVCPWKLLSHVSLNGATCDSIPDNTYTTTTLGDDLIATSTNYGFNEFFSSTNGVHSFKLHHGGLPYQNGYGGKYTKHQKFHTTGVGNQSTTTAPRPSNLCKEHEYYKCSYASPDPTNSACCVRCPTVITGIDEDELFATATKEYIKVYHIINNSDPGSMIVALCSNIDIYGNNLPYEYLQIYEHTPCVIPKQQNANSCTITVASSGDHEYTKGEHSDHTGIYKYNANDVCRYEKQN